MQQPGGRRRIDHVLADDFLSGLRDIDVDELRSRRGEAEQEETDLSYARRLLHGRLDLLRAEQAARAAGGGAGSGLPGDTDALVASLSRALSDAPAASHGLGRHVVAEPSRVGEHRRAAEAAVADPAISDPGGLDDEALAAAVAHLDALQREVGEMRAAVQRASDALSDELGRRYREGVLDVADVLDRESPGTTPG
ncbi:aerial mycelium formation protein [Jannaschia sp. R86511]|uniref:RsiG family protein n=1 Tax=Jannaschia sp. R86511 TaxID=3093853 RepID=UPI0036D40BF6